MSSVSSFDHGILIFFKNSSLKGVIAGGARFPQFAGKRDRKGTTENVDTKLSLWEHSTNRRTWREKCPLQLYTLEPTFRE
jgi:hypothetical protein